MEKDVLEALIKILKNEDKISVAYLFGSKAKGTNTSTSDFDIAVLLSETPTKLLDYYLHLNNKLCGILGDNVDLIILNVAPPMLKHHVIKHGKIIYSRSEKARIMFEAKAENEYLDFSIALKRYDECLMKQILT